MNMANSNAAGNRAGPNRRTFLTGLGSGLAGVALTAMLHRDGVVCAAPKSSPLDYPPKTKSVIWLFMVGGASHLETFDPKPALVKFGGKQIGKTPFQHVLTNPTVKENLREFVPDRKLHQTIFEPQVAFRKRGQSGIEVSDWLPNIGASIDDIAVIRSMWTTDNDHGAQLQFHTGRHALEGYFPTIGAWVDYGLGSLNDDLPQFVVMGRPIADCCGGMGAHGADYLGPEHAGVQLKADPKNALPFGGPGPDTFEQEQRNQFRLLNKLNRLAAAEHLHDAALQARIKSYELAFRMQTAVPDVFRFNEEAAETQELYGLDSSATQPMGQQCLAARRLIERGVRFVQIFHGSSGGAGSWDAHSNLKSGHTTMCGQIDKPIGGLLKDLKRRGLLDETIVVWGTEFGRTPGVEGARGGRDHHPFGFSVWMAGGGIQSGTVHGATDELGFHAVESRHYVTDIHATVLTLLGLDPRKMILPGRPRLDKDFGHPIEEIMA
ncbi:MAG: sulfatase [Planctomycetaceae bacterium]|nr:sulfatase [Planctomycetaceae bacterium]